MPPDIALPDVPAVVVGHRRAAIATPDGEIAVVPTHEAADRLRLTARGFHRVLKLARTLADLDESEGVRRIHVAEALSYRGQSARAAEAA